MTLKIPREEWANFFDDLSKRRFEWRTNLEVINSEFGDQILSDGLPLLGITFEKAAKGPVIEIALVKDRDHHQTHNIFEAEDVEFLPNKNDAGGILKIEETDGTKTLVRLLEPMPVESGYGTYRVASA